LRCDAPGASGKSPDKYRTWLSAIVSLELAHVRVRGRDGRDGIARWWDGRHVAAGGVCGVSRLAVGMGIARQVVRAHMEGTQPSARDITARRARPSNSSAGMLTKSVTSEVH